MNRKSFFLYSFILFISICFISSKPFAQPSQQWVKKYNGPGINKGDIGTAVVTDANGNIYVTGQVSGYGADLDYTTIKYNNSGVQQWLVIYHGPLDTSNNYATAIAVDASGNVYITGASMGIGTQADFATIKYNSAGVQLWLARYNGPGNSGDYGRAIAVDDSGNVYVTGESYNTSSLYNFATVKYNSSGVQQWASIYNGPGNNTDEPTRLAIDNSGNVYVTGYTINGNVTEYATVKYNSSGVQQWASIYNGTNNTTSIANGITVDHQGYVYITGRSIQSGTNEDIVTIKYNPSTGDSVWVRKFNSTASNPDEGYGIAADRYNNIYVTGASNSLSNSTWGIVDIKYNSSGVQQWAAVYTPPGRQSSYGKKIVIDSLGNSFIGGYSLTYTASLHTEDYLTAKFDSNGVMQWINFYNGPGNDRDEGYGIAIDNSGNSYITGLSYAGFVSGSCDYATVKYSAAGVQQWVARYNYPVNSNDYITAMKIDNMGNIYATGTSDGQGTGTDIVLIKFDPAGDTLWVKRFNGPFNSNNNATCMDVDSSGNIYVGGGSWSPDFMDNYYVALKYNSSGNLLWSSFYDGGGYSYIPFSIASDANGNVYEFGVTGYDGIHGNYFLIKFNSGGDTIWTRSIGSNPSGTLAKKVIVDKTGYIYLTGRISNNIYTLKLNSTGDTLWSANYNGTGNSTDQPNDMFVDNNGNVYVTGYSRQ
ncbi:MAG: SBBP repeat-containing protein, partial [Ignavibacteria bacterium]